MAYRNITGIFGHEWISEFSVKMILKELPESHYRVWVRFTDSKNDLLLKECSRTECNLDRIIVEYRDGTSCHDPDPFSSVLWMALSCCSIPFLGPRAFLQGAASVRPGHRQGTKILRTFS